MNAVATGIRKLAQALAFIAGIALALMMLQTVLDVLMNNVFGRPIEGSIEIVSLYYMVLVVFLPLALVELRHEHISADLFVRLLPDRAQRIIYALSALTCVAFFAMLSWQTGQDALQSLRINEVVMGSIYVLVWPAKFALPVGFAAIMLTLLLHAWQALSDPAFHPSPGDPDIGPF